jgi:riboflavin kinase / FMN adenylyltransferase
MTTQFTTYQISGKGRGKFMGFPTINMQVPAGFELVFGIYAVWVTIDAITFKGAMHWGPIPTFDDEKASLEVFLLGLEHQELSSSDTSKIDIVVVERLRDVEKFSSVNELTQQITDDVSKVRKILQD